MIFAGIVIPDSLISAANSGKLVIFAGAGVSKPKPANLPLFKDLVDEIKKQTDLSGRCRNREKDESYEKYLSYLEEQGCDIRSACKNILDTDKTNELHLNLLRFFAHQNQIRIVTTNFDNCFENAYKHLQNDQPLQVFTAPILPLGDNFNGLVHIHGSISDTSSMVLTANDFGKAYVSDGWASHFLVNVFRTYTPLFIGYSCNDVLVDYLTRSISAEINGHAYALVYEKEKYTEWNSRGVETIIFTDYNQLPCIINGMANDISLTITQRVNYIHQLGTPGYNLTSNDEEYLKHILTWDNEREREALTYEFCRSFNGPEYFYLLEKLNLAKSLFKKEQNSSELQILKWAISNFATNSCHKFQDLCFRYCDGIVSSPFINELLSYLVTDDVQPRDVGPWIAWLNNIQLTDNINTAYLLVNLAERCNDPDIVLAIAKILLKIRLNLQKYNINYNNSTYISLIAYEDSDSLVSKLIPIIKANLGYIGEKLFYYCLEQIEDAYSIQTACWTRPDVYDQISTNLFTIGSSSQNTYAYDACCALIDIALICMSEVDIETCAFQCLNSRCLLLIRLGLWMLYNNDYFDHGLTIIEEKHLLDDGVFCYESCELLKRSLPDAADNEKESIVRYIRNCRENNINAIKDYQYFLLCNWMLNDFDYPPLIALFNEILKDNPTFDINENTDFPLQPVNKIITGGEYIITEDDYRLDRLLDKFDGDGLSDFNLSLFNQASSLSKHYPDASLSLIRELTGRKLSTKEIKLARVLIGSFDWSILSTNIDELINILSNCILDNSLICVAINSLYKILFTKEYAFELTYDRLIPLINDIYENIDCIYNLDISRSLSNYDNWLTLSITHPLGQLINIIAYLDSLIITNEQKDQFKSIIVDMLDIILPLLNSETPIAKYALASLFSNLNLWYEYDIELTTKTLLPILKNRNWSYIPCWQGIAYSHPMSTPLWQRIIKYWTELFKKPISLDQDTLNALCARYCRYTIYHKKGQNRKQMIALCASSSPEFCQSTYHYIDHWLHLQNINDLPKIWDSWLETVTFDLMGNKDKQIINALIKFIIRWITKYPSLRSRLINLLNDERIKSCNATISVNDNELNDIVNDDTLSYNDRAIYIIFFLNHMQYLYSNDDLATVFNYILSILNINEIDRNIYSELEEAYTYKGLSYLFDK